MGYLLFNDPDPWRSKGQVSVVENDTFTCCHCGRIVRLVHGDPKPGRELHQQNVKNVYACRKCNAPVCTLCSIKPCDPLEEKMKRLER